MLDRLQRIMNEFKLQSNNELKYKLQYGGVMIIYS